ncbi:2-oxoglutarate dehydrogenase complex dihydrolipoyllysine-residue succinyltransferase [Kiloniella sp. EL199]|uniref:2-oxoglutarate dehydrogenase complex dihydrolipoyllysine-residue succinyltransferase n=1 Tax=Kiloniella sp. EL199 TaxID=2107581 RepID=UPI000EA0E8C5|nr:2-oxoglutarate dehydrogenase complex dihydrolipoyllysine-residue succinyltransferase [Kiloniella sp. EL199]
MATEIVVPALGESVTEATVAKWLKQPGEAVAMDEAIVELETDKVTLEVNASVAGVLEGIVANEGDDVEVGALLGSIAEGAAASSASVTSSAPLEEVTSKEEPAVVEATGDPVEIPVPVLGESVTEATVAQWMKSVGDAVAQDEAICELETDKVTLEVNAPVAGVLTSIAAEADSDVGVGAILGVITPGSGGVAAPAKAAASSPTPSQTVPQAAVSAAGDNLDPSQISGSGAGGKVTTADLVAFLEGNTSPAAMTLPPAVAKLISENNLNPHQVKGTGKDGALTKGDVLEHLKNPPSASAPIIPVGAAPVPTTASVPASVTPERETREKMSKMRKTISRRLKEAQNTAAMLTTFNEIDMFAVMDARKQYKEAFEKKHGVRLGFNSFFAKAVVQALQDVPSVNARIDGDDIVYNNFFDIGMAVSTPSGLMVPVIRDCDKKSFAEIEGSLGDLAKKGRDGKLGMDDMTGGSFTITNGGVFGSLLSTPILNMPQAAILGLHKIEERPIAVNGQVVVRPMMYTALSYDHRLIDGREAVTFLVRIKECMEDPQRLLLSM